MNRGWSGAAAVTGFHHTTLITTWPTMPTAVDRMPMLTANMPIKVVLRALFAPATRGLFDIEMRLTYRV
jgi:hypothetical protein